MEDNFPEKEGLKEAKRYASISSRLPAVDADLFNLYCNKIGTNPSERIRQLILLDMKKPQTHIRSGINKIGYNRINNSFSWVVELDSGESIEVLNNLSDSFLKNLQEEIQDAIKQRNQWVHQVHADSVDVPGELIGGERK